jgi:hypothetical protein
MPTHDEVRKLVRKEVDIGAFNIDMTVGVPACDWKQENPDESTPVWNTDDWVIYGYKALDLYQKTLDGNHTPNWSDVKFRAESHFMAGSFNSMIQIWPVLIHNLPDDMKAECYSTLFHGVSLFDNLSFIEEKEPIEFRQVKIATYYRTNPDFVERYRATKKVCNKIRKEQGLKALPFDDVSSGGYLEQRRVLYPGYAKSNDRKKALVVPNPVSLVNHHEVVLPQIKKWIKTGALEHVPKTDKSVPLLTSAIIVVPKQGPEKWRVCFDGSPIKAIERFTQPCHLDTCGDALKVLQKGDLLVKMDDKSGFHQLLLDKFSRQLAYCKYGDESFRYRGAAFGYPKIPGLYQLINGIPINLLRKNGIKCFLYLDDRLFIIRPKSKEHRERLLTGQETPLGPYLGALLMTSVGTYINRAKSVLTPKPVIDYLGFTVNCDKGTVKIPTEKWEVFKTEAAAIRKLDFVRHKRLERFRGKCASFALVVKEMRLYIRRITDELKNLKLVIPVTDELKEELTVWIECRYIARERTWIRHGISTAHITEISTDASNFACGLVIDDLGLKETVYWKENGEIAKGDIFLKEAFAIWYVLRTYGQKLQNRRVHFYNDNQSVCHTFEVGSTKKSVTTVIREIHQTAIRFNIQLDISWVPSEEQAADEASRTVDVKEAIFRQVNFEALEKKLKVKFTLDAMATRQNTKCENFISLRQVNNSWNTDFLVQKHLSSHKIWVYPPKVVTLVVFQHLQRIAKKNFWCLVLVDYETLGPVWSEIYDNKNLQVISNLGQDPILFPSKTRHEKYGYWKVPKKAQVSVVVHTPESHKRKLLK